MKKLYFFVIAILVTAKLFPQNIGVGITTPNSSALLHVDLASSTTKGFLVTGTYNSLSTIPDLGAGSRLMFYPGKAAFRTGYISSTHWDNAYVGLYSIAMGYNTIASGNTSIAMGSNTNANSFTSIAMGDGTTASGTTSTAMGSNTNASGQYSTAIGRNTIASGGISTAMGYNTNASGNYSTAMGTQVSTNNQTGAFVIGDSDPNNQGSAMPGQPDLFVARFNNGYYLYTSGVTTNIGVAINHNGNAWLSVCDRNLKENFEPLNGEDVLQKISKINFTSWNYKQQDPKIYRHYGIMAQDFHAAFGYDDYGTIGNDTTVNPIDMIGIDMTAIQALEKRTTELKIENEKLKIKNEELENKFNEQQKLIEKILKNKKLN